MNKLTQSYNPAKLNPLFFLSSTVPLRGNWVLYKYILELLDTTKIVSNKESKKLRQQKPTC